MTKAILKLSQKYNGNWDKVYEAISAKERIEIEKGSLDNIKDSYIFIGDNNYPNKLKEILVPPFFLFYKGDAELLENNNVISINFDVNEEQIKEIIKKLSIDQENVICMNTAQITTSVYNYLKSKNIRLIIVAEGGINLSKYVDLIQQNDLVISEYCDHTTYDAASDQSIERLVFAFGDKLIINTDAMFENSNNKLLINQKQIKKPLFDSKTLKEIA